MKKILITASEPFGKYITHPAKWLALSADGKIISGYEIHSLIFPSVVIVPEGTTNPGKIIVKKAQEIDAEAIISFGMSSAVNGFQLERSGTNWAYNEKYLSAEENNRPLETSQPAKEQLQADMSYWDINKMQKLFAEADIPFEPNISDDPGQYSCNSWIYRTLLALREHKLKIPYLFVHSACTKEAIELIPEFDKNKTLIKNQDMLKALEIILESKVNH